MKRITNREVFATKGHCERCGEGSSRVIYTVTAEDGKKEYLCEDCVSKDDEIE